MLDTMLLVAGIASAIGWLHLLTRRGGFWRADQRLPKAPATLGHWPPVAVVIPARDEADGIGLAVNSLLAQDYPGEFNVIVVDDGSTDGTAAVAERAAGGDRRLTVIAGSALPSGWTGKLWAVHNGVREALRRWPATEFLLLTDADIVHSADNLRRLVGKAETEDRDLVSLMVRLRCRDFWERMLIPPFVFFFQKLYPFPWVNDPGRPEAAAAGGCLLVRTEALVAAGGVAAIRGRLIDDCALAGRIKRRGSIWLGLGEDTVSLRAYPTLRELWAMVARTAYTQLGHSPRNLLATVVGMILLYTVPPVAVVTGLYSADLPRAVPGALAWGMMILSFAPTGMLYGRALAGCAALPLAAILYVAMTVDSARLYRLGRGGLWKGRHFDHRPQPERQRELCGDLGSEPPW